MNTAVDSHTRGDDELAPGDYSIDTTNTTLFEVMDHQREGREPWQIAQVLGVTSDQVYLALDYLAQHRREVEAAYRADRRATAHHVLSALVGSYRPQWQEWMLVIGGMGMGIVLFAIGIAIAHPFFVSTSVYQSTFAVVVNACASLFCVVIGLGMLGLGSRLLVDIATLRYEVSATMLTATRYGKIPACAISRESVVQVDVRGRFLYMTCEDGTTYRIWGMKQLRDAVNAVPHYPASRDVFPPS